MYIYLIASLSTHRARTHKVKRKKPSNNPTGRPSNGLAEASKLLTGPAELFAAMNVRAAAHGIKSSEAWRTAARAWLDADATIPKTKTQAPAPPRDTTDARVLRQVVDHYHQALLSPGDGLSYLKQHGLGDHETITAHKLGFVDRTLRVGLGLSERDRELRVRLRRLGVLGESWLEVFSNCIVVPVLAANGDVLGLYGRPLFLPRKSAPRDIYLPGTDREVWNASALRGTTEVVLCNAPLDALTFWSAGFRNVTTIGGAGVTAAHLDALKTSGASRVLLAFGSQKGTDRSVVGKKLQAEGFEVAHVLFPRGLSVNDFALKTKVAKKSLGAALHLARSTSNSRGQSFE